jgi:carboxymethylenebutenolidase
MGRMIDFSGKQGYLAIPEAGSGPAVVVVQEWWGLVGHIKDVVDRFAAEGFVALAPDLYDGDSTKEPDEAGSMMMALQMPEVRAKLSSAAEALLAMPESTSEKAGVVGFCMGGQLALFGAASDPDRFSCCVNFYGIHPNANPPLENLGGPVLGIFAEHDEYTGPDAVAALDEKLNALGKAHEFVTYPGTQHAFFNDDRPEVYDAEAAADAWNRTIAFLKTNVR